MGIEHGRQAGFLGSARLTHRGLSQEEGVDNPICGQLLPERLAI
ncbi:MAG: hypothetical protein PHI96_06005 [Desulfovibrio sp.]|nr:hypothetical protein [Desulfovibrio sp.]